ncbi:ABC transporter permease [Frigoribacterium faeni]|uniref:ABC transporter permease n=1 Tax=Frigoribacterium faeni TaxID=145483 RepID=A0A7W3PHN1_9MICO|nr:ABC transporter permease [Frigoribacterium faeni]MBA8811902.1 peptide/nickel transport system permease protein [Frigoribacterium faeni]GEK84638.1 ABC transporter permease [Frigoribacterium faeni]
MSTDALTPTATTRPSPPTRPRRRGAGLADRVRPLLARLGAADVVALVVVALVVLAAVAPQLLTPYDPLVPESGSVLVSPTGAHPFGTDYLGRDILSRVLHGTARTLTGSAVAVLIGLGVGTLLGLLAASAGGLVDGLISRLVDVLLSIPGLLLSMVVVVALGFGALNAAIAVGISSIAVFTRLMRSEVLTVKGLTFVEAGRHLGATRARVLLTHVLPNSLSAVLSLAALQFGLSILWISALSFLGYGAPPPEPEWGLLVSEGREYIVSSPWLIFAPGLVITATVLSISRVAQFVKEGLS